MSKQSKIVSPGLDERTVRTSSGEILFVPVDWVLLLPGDAGLTRRVKATGPSWTVQEKRGRKTFARGIWAPSTNIDEARANLEAERSLPAYAKRLQTDRRRREQQQLEYVAEFERAVINYLAFADIYAELATRLAKAVAEHATPVGSGTVARTKRITIEQRAEAAVIAWLRHQTTTYEQMKIPRVKGKRREVRRMLAQQSKQLLAVYRSGGAVDPKSCPLVASLNTLALATPSI